MNQASGCCSEPWRSSQPNEWPRRKPLLPFEESGGALVCVAVEVAYMDMGLVSGLNLLCFVDAYGLDRNLEE